MVDMVKVKVAEGKKLYWNHRDREGGEVIEVPEKEARLIVALKKGTLVKHEPAAPVPEPQPLQTTIEEDTDLPREPSGRRYRRRDMKADEE